MELELSRSMSLLQRGDEFSTEDLAESPYREEEIVLSGAHPMHVIPRQAAGGHNAVNVGMMLELLIPGVKDTEKADVGTEMLGIGGNFDQCFRAAAEQQTIDHCFVLQGQRRQLMGKREDDMRIRCGEQFTMSRRQPAVARLALTLWAVPVAARVERDGTMAAICALIQMATHGGRAAAPDGTQYLQVQPGKPGGRPIQESVAGCAYQIGQLQQWPFHLRAATVFWIGFRCQQERVEGARDGL
jgi:hypothetical protein